MEAIMEKLSMQDATFLYSETDKVLNQIASLQQLELPQNTTPEAFITSLKIYLMDRVHLLPYLTRKVKMIPGGIDHAVWVRDGHFDINNHVVEIPLEAPGTFAQLEAKVAELHAIPMNRDRPLWCMHVITGQDDGSVAYYAQVHHACVDGMAGQALTLTLTDETPEPQTKHCPADFIQDEDPELGDLLSASFKNLFDFQANSLERATGVLKAATKLGQRLVDPSKSFGALGQTTPKTPFNHAIERPRSFACTRMPLNDVKKIGKTMDASINDVFMSLCAGALRSYLSRTEQLPKDNLIAGCPVAIPRKGSFDRGNSVSIMSVDLFTSIADPRVRLLKIKGSAKTAKEVTADLAEGFDSNVSLFGLPALTRAASLANEYSGASETMPMPFNVLVSNVPGPSQRLYANGAKMLSHYPVSIPTHGLGLNITVQSYCGELFVGLTACKKSVPDLPALRDDLAAAFVELKALTLPDNILEIGVQRSSSAITEPAKSDKTAENLHKVA
ncbi:MAG: WS/DGAT/MGAT family acyltransferase [Candidatus Azotimanducaceae bacterium]|jgi:WS/DGAT/MGAT family acyltransferase